MKLEWVKIIHCPEQDEDVNADDCAFCEHYEDTDDHAECIVCNFKEVDM